MFCAGPSAQQEATVIDLTANLSALDIAVDQIQVEMEDGKNPRYIAGTSARTFYHFALIECAKSMSTDQFTAALQMAHEKMRRSRQ
jgi:hypothetical protein